MRLTLIDRIARNSCFGAAHQNSFLIVSSHPKTPNKTKHCDIYVTIIQKRISYQKGGGLETTNVSLQAVAFAHQLLKLEFKARLQHTAYYQEAVLMGSSKTTVLGNSVNKC